MIKHKMIEKFKFVFLTLLIGFSAVGGNLSHVNAVSYEMNTYNYLGGVTQLKGAKMNDGTILEGSTYKQGTTVLLTKNGKYFYCLEHGKGVHNGSQYNPNNDPIDLIEEAQKNTNISAYQKGRLISRLLSLAPQDINVSYNTSGSLKSVKGNAYQWFAAQIITWEIMVGERNADGTYRGVTTSGATSVWNGFNWSDSTVKSNVKKYYDALSSTLIAWDTIPSFASRTEKASQTYELNQYDGNYFYTELNDTNDVLKNYDFSANGLTFNKNGNKLKISTSADQSFTDTKSVLGTNSLELNKKQLICLDSDSQYQKTAIVGKIEDPTPNAFFKIKIGVGNLKIIKKDNKGNTVANVEFELSYNADMSNPIGKYKTDKNGIISIDGLRVQKIYIQEKSVDKHLILDSSIHSIDIRSADTVTFTQVNNWKQGYIQVIKKDKKTNQTVKKAGTEFEILSGSKVVSTIITNSEGVAKSELLDYGIYTVREKKAPQNYTIATLNQNQDITENNKTYEIIMFNEPVLGEIELTKQDKETGNTAQGDAILTGAKYVLKANKQVLNPSDSSVLYDKDEVVSVKNVGNGVWGDTGSKETDKNAKIKWSNLPMGEYRIEEQESSEGYLLDNKHVVSLAPTNQLEKIISEKVTSHEQVIKGKLEIAKSGNNGSSGVIQGLGDVEFTLKLYSEVQKVGWDNAKIYSLIKTDLHGRGISELIPYGIYLVKETKTPPNYMAGGDFFVNIDKDKEIEYRMVNNAPFQSWLKIVKQDENGNNITVSNATFKIKDKNGNYIKQKVGLFYKDEWKTNNEGIAILDNMLVQGEYIIEELKSPDGFLLGSNIKVNISSHNENITFDKDNEPVITVKFKNEKPYGKIVLHKAFENLNDEAVGGAVFKLTANNDIINATNGKIIYKKGEVVNKDTATDGLYSTDESGKISISGLPLNPEGVTSYKLEEVSTVEGYSLLNEPIIFDFEIKDDKTKEYIIEKSVSNKLTETLITKLDVADSRELEGAYLSLFDKNDKLIEKWVSGKEPHLIKGLHAGKEYRLHEDLAPLGYLTTSDIMFTVKEDGSVTKVTMKDEMTTTEISKVDTTDSKELEGAHLSLFDKDGNLVEKWISSNEVHIIRGLHIGEEYRLHEDLAPLGYLTANDITFTVKGDGSATKVTMKDEMTTTEISKVDATDSKELEDAHLSLFDKNGNLVEKWISSNEVHIIRGLHIGEEYRLHEDLAPLGYATASDITFKVKEDGSVTKVTMKDEITKVDISKVDATSGEELEGAKMTLSDKETGEILERWISGKESHRILGLTAGKTYVLHEEIAPDGYLVAEDVEFTVLDSGEVQKVIMKDERKPAVAKTGDDIDIYTISVLAGASALLIVALIVRIRSKRNEKK